MSQPFIISMKAFFDATGVKAGSREAEQALLRLNRQAASTEAGLRGRIERTVGISASGRGFKQAEADIAAYGARLDELRAKYNPVYAAHMRYRQSLTEIRQAHSTGAISADEMARAIQRERQATLASIAALKGRTSAINSMGAATTRMTFQQRNLMYQLVDVGQMLALQQPLHMLALQQGPQIAQIYGPGEGGIGRAFSESGKMIGSFVSKFAKIGGVIGLAVGALAGFTHEIDKATDKSVGMGDVIVATFQVIGAGLYDAYIKPFETQLQGMWDWIWDGTIWLTKTLINSVVVTVGAAGLSVEYAVLGLWNLIRGTASAMQNFFVDALESISNFIIGGINTLIENVNSMLSSIGADKAAELFGLPGQIGTVAPVDLSAGRSNFDFTGEMASLNQNYGDAFNSLFTDDHAGNFFDSVLGQAVENLSEVDEEAAKTAARLEAAYDRIVASARERIEGLKLEAQTLGMTEEAANRLRYAQDLMNQAQNAGISLTGEQQRELQGLAAELAATEAQTKRLTDLYNFGKETFSSFFSDMKTGLSDGKSLWEALGNAGANALDRIADKALGMAADGIFDLIFGAVMGGVTGAPSAGGLDLSGLFGIGTNANGTSHWRGGLSWVGERGPEIVNLPRGSEVIPNHRLHSVFNSPFNAGNDNWGGGGQNVVHFAPTTHVDARGSRHSAHEIRAIVQDEQERMVEHWGTINADRARRAAPGMR